MNYFFTNSLPDAGTGNKLFVYFLGKILSNLYNIPYYHIAIPELKIEENKIDDKNKNNFKNIDVYNIIPQNEFNKNINYRIIYNFIPTIENYKIFKNYISICKDAYKIRKKNFNNEDLVYHFRAGDYFFDNNHYLLNGDKLEKLLKSIKYNKLYVVTNLTKKTEWNMDDYLEYRKIYLKKGFHASPYHISICVQPNKYQEVLDHINSIIYVCNKYNCTWISESVYEDFNTIRNFNKIIVNVSTLSWWAAVLSDANEVYVPEKWKYKKGIKNKNLAQIDLPGWHQVDL